MPVIPIRNPDPQGFALDLFPRIAWYPIGGTQATTYPLTAFTNRAGKYNLVIMSNYLGMETDMGATFASVHSTIRSNGTANGIQSRPVHYVMQQEYAESSASGRGNTYTKLVAQINLCNWWLRATYPTGTIVAGDSSNTGVIDPGNPTYSTAPGFVNVNQFWAYYFYNVFTQGNAASLFGESTSFAANPNVAGVFLDNQFWAPRGTAQGWPVNMTGAWSAGSLGSVAYNTYATTSPIMQTGQAQSVAAFRSRWPAVLVGGNCDYGTYVGFGSAPLLSGQAGIYDYALMESAIGQSFSLEHNGFTALMNGYIGGESVLARNGTQIFHVSGRPTGVAWTSATTQSSWVAADWQALRYGEAIAWLRNGHFAMAFDNNYQVQNMVNMWSDTFDRGGRGLAWMGYAVDPPQSTAQFPNGVFGRHFSNALVLVNPRGNGSQTVTLPPGVYYTLPANGFSDTLINTDVQVSSVTLADGDARVLAKVP